MGGCFFCPLTAPIQAAAPAPRIPRCNKALRYLRDEKIRADFDRLTESKSSVEAVNILTRDYGLCCRQVWYILKGY